MKRVLLSLSLAIAAVLSSASTADAQHPGGYFGGGPFFGGYFPAYGSSIRTPPYFAMHPPVYYGARYARPYGLSPFPAPSMLSAPDTYRGRLESQFIEPQGTGGGAPNCNPCVSHSEVFAGKTSSSDSIANRGPVRTNPFVDSETATVDRLVRNER